jgi:serine/threonine-protein kinase RsbW
MAGEVQVPVLVKVQLLLPRDTRYVPLLRNVAKSLLADLGAPTDASHDIQVAVSEACANAIRHAAGSTAYMVSLGVERDRCEVEVVDTGRLDQPLPGAPDEAHVDAEAGRGLLLMRALVDDFQFTRNDDATCVRLTKTWPGLHFGSEDPPELDAAPRD